MVNKPQYKNSLVILIAEDDDDDYLLTMDAFKESNLLNPVHRVKDGQELLDYLYQKNGYDDPDTSPFPFIILLDLNMPKKNGIEALKEIKANPKFSKIPVIVLTTSKAEEDILSCYNLGVHSFIKKPVTFEAFVKVTKIFKQYWLEIVEVPSA